jgi:AcrR family transcriptional regulator
MSTQRPDSRRDVFLPVECVPAHDDSGVASRPTSRRRGPRGDVDTRTVIIDTAERMFAQASIDSVSMRAVARETGVAPRAVVHHFPTKGDLIAAVVQRRSRPIAEATSHRLRVLVDTANQVHVREVVEAVVMPYVEMLDAEPVSGLHWMRLFSQLALNDHEIWLDELGTDPSLTDLFVAAASRAIPGLQTYDVRLRAGIAMFSMTAALASADRPAYGRPLSPDGLDRRWLNQLIEFTSGGMRGITDQQDTFE